MALKIETRFAPSVVRAAQMIEAMRALVNVTSAHPLGAKASSSFMRLGNDLMRRRAQLVSLPMHTGYDVEACIEEMQADRARKAKERKLAMQRRQLEREKLAMDYPELSMA